MLKIDVIADGTVPIGLQVKEQIRWQIATGQLQPGDQIPSVRDLSDQLGIGKNTVNTVYAELRSEGLLRMGRGRETEIAAGESVRQLARVASLLTVLDEAFEAAFRSGFTAEEVADTAQVRARLLGLQKAAAGEIIFVEDPDHEVEAFLRQIREVTGLPVRLLPLKVFLADPAAAGTKLVTTCLSSQAVREAVAPETEIVYLGIRVHLRAVLQVSQLPAGARVVFVGRSRTSVDFIVREIAREAEHLILESVGIHEPGAPAALRAAQAIYAVPSVYGQVAEQVDDPSRVHRFEVALDMASEESLRALASAK